MAATDTKRGGEVRLDLEGMTCASCAARIESKLNKLDGVEATVNFATEQATVALRPGGAPSSELVGAVESAGYGARRPRAAHDARPTSHRSRRAARRARAGGSRVAVVADRPGRAARDGAAAPVRRLGVGRARALDAGRLLLRARLPPRRARERAPRRGDDGHADLARHARRLDAGRRSCSSAASTPTPTSRSRR